MKSLIGVPRCGSKRNRKTRDVFFLDIEAHWPERWPREVILEAAAFSPEFHVPSFPRRTDVVEHVDHAKDRRRARMMIAIIAALGVHPGGHATGRLGR